MGRIDYQLIGPAALGRQCRKYPVEHAYPAPADGAVIDRLGRAVIGRGIAPAQTITSHENDPVDNPTIIDPRHPVRQRKVWLNPAHLRLRHPDQVTHGSVSSQSYLIN